LPRRGALPGTFVETDGRIAIEALHVARAVTGDGVAWKTWTASGACWAP
jgi:hypothetical protein